MTRGRQPPHSIQTAGGSGAGVIREGLQGGMTCPKRVYQSLSEKECCKTGWAVDICATPSIEGFGGKGIEVTTDNECGIIVGGRAYLSLDKMVECFFSLQERAVGKAWARSPDRSVDSYNA